MRFKLFLLSVTLSSAVLLSGCNSILQTVEDVGDLLPASLPNLDTLSDLLPIPEVNNDNEALEENNVVIPELDNDIVPEPEIDFSPKMDNNITDSQTTNHPIVEENNDNEPPEVSQSNNDVSNDVSEVSSNEGEVEVAEPDNIVTVTSVKTAGDTLTGLSRKIYDLLAEKIKKVAAGDQESTVFRFSMEELGLAGLSWTPEELGVNVILDNTNNYNQRTWDAIISAIYRETELDSASQHSVYYKLQCDFPYELYWHQTSGKDTLPGIEWSYQVSFIRNNGQVSFTSDSYLEVTMLVSESYAKVVDESHYNPYSVDTERTSRAAAIAENAKKIVAENARKSDYEKLLAYKTAICDLVSYNYTAAENDTSLSGIDPWQIIWVFDNDPSTNVVCEGYAKAFQYLCNLSTFNGDVTSYIISGNLSGDESAPTGHMWNHVRINGQYWLVDITNCDTGMIGQPNKLFLKAPYRQGWSSTSPSYVFAGNGDAFSYYRDIENYYEDDSILHLASEDYV